MDSTQLRKRLEHSGHAIASLLEKVDSNEASWKPADDRWSLVEIINHLVDEEREDFRFRLQSIAEDPTRTWPPFDSLDWVKSREYAKRDFAESYSTWKQERNLSLEWLARSSVIDPDVRYVGARSSDVPPRTAGDLMLSWLAHDYFHVRQITLLRWDYLDATGAPFSTEYAGPRN